MLKSAISSVFTILLILLFSFKIGSLPPLGKMFHPRMGFWGNAENKNESRNKQIRLPILKKPATVWYDDNHVPHIHASNEEDLYALQGYIMAADRLWQMEFQTHAAAGRISEIMGNDERYIEFDKNQRRTGMLYGAKNTEELFRSDTLMNMIVTNFTKGVNAYIENLSEQNLPIEYKLLNYRPEPWTPLKCALIQKLMANDLTGKSYDLDYTVLKDKLGLEDFNMLYPVFPDSIDPIVPQYNFDNNSEEDLTAPPASTTVGQGVATLNTPTLDENFLALDKPSSFHPIAEPNPMNGSNNWAVAPSKSADSVAILCNDPHLALKLPSIWYQMHLNTPTMNVYGVAIPGAPGIIIGFNENIAWGVTNGTRDVKDYYKIHFRDSNREEYMLDSTWVKTNKVIEEIKIRGAESVTDTVIYTHWGPLMRTPNSKENVSVQWMGYRPGKELLTFYYLNEAKNYEDYKKAIAYFECPSQNFIFSDVNGEIAIWNQGKFVNEDATHRFLLDGDSSANGWNDYIPQSANPHSYNSIRGFVSSANQHPTYNTYPYTYFGEFEMYRNRRINHILRGQNKFTITDMEKMQNDNYNLVAAENLPYILDHIDKNKLDVANIGIYQVLQEWDYMNNPQSIAASYYEVFYQSIYNMLWDEKVFEGMKKPSYFMTNQFIRTASDSSKYFDLESTKTIKEDRVQFLKIAFTHALDSIKNWKAKNGNDMVWYNFKNTTIQHLMMLPAFSVSNVKIGGNSHIINACNSTHGPSWRMIVSMKKSMPEALGIFPGGQSGNPGSKYYDNMIETWAEGKYKKLIFYNQKDINKMFESANQILQFN